jgi:hypothetical protein
MNIKRNKKKREKGYTIITIDSVYLDKAIDPLPVICGEFPSVMQFCSSFPLLSSLTPRISLRHSLIFVLYFMKSGNPNSFLNFPIYKNF